MKNTIETDRGKARREIMVEQPTSQEMGMTALAMFRSQTSSRQACIAATNHDI
ncbi:hypothetical protein [Permianibacter aggregans]|uniref:hypothetical protein n=1 Tax=Permianibacter aggregans TaxID=1510150 RepID=UPI0012FA79CD|nr:hypothetical protein [Permianibacter aggregans]